MTNPETWIVYKAETMSAPGWEDRQLLPADHTELGKTPAR